MKKITARTVELIEAASNEKGGKGKLAKFLKIPASAISDICNGRRKAIGGKLIDKLSILNGFSDTLVGLEEMLHREVSLEMTEILRSRLAAKLENYYLPASAQPITLEERLKINREHLEGFVDGSYKLNNHQLVRLYVLLVGSEPKFEEEFLEEVISAQYVLDNFECRFISIDERINFIYEGHELKNLPYFYSAPVPCLDLCIEEFSGEIKLYRKLNVHEKIKNKEVFVNQKNSRFRSHRHDDEYRVFFRAINKPVSIISKPDAEETVKNLDLVCESIRGNGTTFIFRSSNSELSPGDFTEIMSATGENVYNPESMMSFLRENTVEVKPWKDATNKFSICRRFKIEKGILIQEWEVPIDLVCDIYKCF